MSDSRPVQLVLGAAGGIGSATSRRLTAAGQRVVLASRRVDVLQALGAELDAAFLELTGPGVEAIADVVGRAGEIHERLDGIVNCIGSLILKPAHRTSEAEWRETIDVNLGSAFATVRAGAQAMLKTGGSIVLVSSAAARIGLANHEAIAAAKAGVMGLTLAAASSYAARGIRVNAVAPGLVQTPLTERLTGGASGEASRAMHALGRLGNPEDVASAIAWLADPEQSWVTGQVLGVDGGLGSLRAR